MWVGFRLPGEHGGEPWGEILVDPAAVGAETVRPAVHLMGFDAHACVTQRRNRSDGESCEQMAVAYSHGFLRYSILVQ